MSDTEQALLRAMLESPDDDMPRLVIADYWDENGQGERAEFVRVQIELSGRPFPDTQCVKCGRLASTTPGQKYCGRGDDKDNGHNYQLTPKAVCLRNREKELWGYLPERNGVLSRLSASSPGYALLLNSDNGSGLTHDYPWAIVSRGFPSEVRLTMRQFVGGGECRECDGKGDYLHPTHYRQPCKVCKGSKLDFGLAKEIASRWPVTRVVLTDREPGRSHVYSQFQYGWHGTTSDGHLNHNHVVPMPIMDLMVGQDRPAYAGYRTAEAAHDALSIAAVNYARSLVEPPLTAIGVK